MKLFGESSGPVFKARIKPGTAIGHDMRYMRWPKCFAPGGGDVASDPDMEFDAEDRGHYFDLKANGFGVLSVRRQYGSGSIHVTSMHDLIMDEANLAAAVAVRREAKLKQIAEADSVVEKLRSELATLDKLTT